MGVKVHRFQTETLPSAAGGTEETHRMNAPEPVAAPATMSSADYAESLRRLKPVVWVDGRRIESVADEPALRPGVRALGVTYDMARDPALAPLMLATDAEGRTVPRMLHLNLSAGDLLNKLEAVR